MIRVSPGSDRTGKERTMKEYELKYGCNPNQKPARIFMENGQELPLQILNGRPGYINLLDALNSWQLVREIREALGVCAAASFKHVSPTSAAIGLTMSERQKKAFFVDDIEGLDDSKIATAYARARGTDRMSSFGDISHLYANNEPPAFAARFCEAYGNEEQRHD